MSKKLMAVIIAGALSVPFSVLADDAARAAAKQTIELKDGSKVYIFKDGKMGMENKLGRAVQMKEGMVMETKDGQKIIMHGNEISRLERLLEKDHKGG